MMVTLRAVRLSSNPATQVVAEASGIGGKANCASDGTLFVVVEVEGGENPFKKNRAVFTYRMSNEKWPGESPAQLQKRIGKEIPGCFKSAAVEPYEIMDTATGESRMLTTTTIFVQEGQGLSAALRSKGFVPIGEDAAVPASERVVG